MVQSLTPTGYCDYIPDANYSVQSDAEAEAEELLGNIKQLIEDTKAFVAKRAKELSLEFDAPTKQIPDPIFIYLEETIEGAFCDSITQCNRVLEA